MHGRRLGLSLAVAVVFLASAGTALAITGSLTPKGCIGDKGSNPDSCTEATKGLKFPQAISVTTDGRSVYVVTGTSNSILAFSRSRKSGALTPAGCIADKATNPDGCSKTSAGLNDADAVTVSPDGRSVYVASYEDNAIAVFDRDTKTGALRPAGCIGSTDNNTSHCKQTTRGLDYAESVVVSPDGKFVYEGGDEAAVVIFSRSKVGALKPMGCVAALDDNYAKCPHTTRGLNGDVHVAISRDGKSVYAVSSSDNGVVAFQRNTKTGALKPKGCIAASGANPGGCTKTTPELGYPIDIAVAPDGTSVYVPALNSSSLVIFHRNPETGALTAKGCISGGGCGQTAEGLHGAVSVALSADGKSVYTAAIHDNAVTVFKRKTSGALKPAGCFAEPPTITCQSVAPGLGGADGVAVSADGTSVYAVGGGSNAIVRFKRG